MVKVFSLTHNLKPISQEDTDTLSETQETHPTLQINQAELPSDNIRNEFSQKSKAFVCSYPSCGKSYGRKHHLV